MTENTPLTFDDSNYNLPDDIPLGNHSPLLVPKALGQSFLQTKFIYPLGAVSILNPDNIGFNDFELLNNSFESSPFLDQPSQSFTQSKSFPSATNQPDIQAKSLLSPTTRQTKRSPQNSPKPSKNISVQRKSLETSQQESRFSAPLNQPNQNLVANTPIEASTLENISIQRYEDLPTVSNANIEIEGSPNSFGAESDTSIDSPIYSNDNLQSIQSNIDSQSISSSNLGSDRIQEIQRKPEISNPNPVSIISDVKPQEIPPNEPSTKQIQRVSEIPSQNVPTQQILLSSNLPVAENSVEVSDRTQSIQRNIDSTSSVDTSNSILQSDQELHTDSDLSNVNIDVKPSTQIIDALQRKSEISASDEISPRDRYNQINPDFQVSDRISPNEQNAQPIQRASDKLSANLSASIQNQQQKTSDSPSAINNIEQSDRTPSIQRNIDADSIDPNTSSSNISNSNLVQDNRILQADIKPDSLGIQTNQSESIQEIQRKADMSPTSILQRTQAIEPQVVSEPLSEPSTVNNTSQSSNAQVIQRISDNSGTDVVIDNSILQIDRIPEVQRESDRSVNETFVDIDNSQIESSQLPQAQYIADISTLQSDRVQGIQTKSDLASVYSDTSSASSQEGYISEALGSAFVNNPTVSEDRSILQNSDRTQEIQKKSDQNTSNNVSTSDLVQENQPFSDLSNLNSNIEQTNLTQSIQRSSDLSIGNPNILDRNFDLGTQENSDAVNNALQGNLTSSVQRKVDLSATDSDPIVNNINIQEIQRNTDLDIPETSIDLSTHQSSIFPLTSGDLDTPDKSIDGFIQQDKSNQGIQRSTIVDIPEISPLEISRISTLNNPEAILSNATPRIEPSPIVQSKPDLPVADSNILQSDRTLEIQAQSDLNSPENFADWNTALSSLPQTIQTKSDLSVLDNADSRTDLTIEVQRQSDVFSIGSESGILESNIAVPQVQQVSDLASHENIVDNSTLQGNLTPKVQKKSDSNIPEEITATNILQGDLPQTIQSKPDLPIADSTILQSDRTPEVQRQSDSNFADSNILQNDSIPEVRRADDLEPPKTIIGNTDLIPKVQRQSDSSSIDNNVLQDNIALEVQQISDLVSPEILDNNILRSDRVSEVQRTLDESSSETIADNPILQSDRISEIQRDVDLTSPETFADKTISQGNSNQEMQKTSSFVNPEISVDSSPLHNDRSPELQRKSDLVTSKISTDSTLLQGDRVQESNRNSELISSENPVSTTILQNDLPPDVQKQSDLISAENTTDKSVSQIELSQTIQSKSSIPITDSNNLQSDRVLGIQRDIDLTSPETFADKTISQNIPNQSIQEVSGFVNPETSVDSSAPQNDRILELQRKSDSSGSENPIGNNISQIDLLQTPQTQSDLSTVNRAAPLSDRTPEVQREPYLASPVNFIDSGVSQIETSQTIQAKSDLSVENDAVFQGERTLEVQRQAEISSVDSHIWQGDNAPEVQQTSDAVSSRTDMGNSVSQSDSTSVLQRKSDLSSSQTPIDSYVEQNNHVPESQDVNSISSPESFTYNNVLQEPAAQEIQSAQEIQRKSDLTTPETFANKSTTSQNDRSNSSSDLTVPEASESKNILLQSDLTTEIQRKSDSTSSENPLDSDVLRIDPLQSIQTQSDLSVIDSDILPSDRVSGIQKNIDLTSSESFVNEYISQADRTPEVQRKSDLVTPEISLDNIVQQSDRISQSQNIDSMTSSTVSQELTAREIQRKSDLAKPKISTDISTHSTDTSTQQNNSTLEVQRVSDLNSTENPESSIDSYISQLDRKQAPPTQSDLPVDSDFRSSDRPLADRSPEIQRASDLSSTTSTYNDVSQGNINPDIQRTFDLTSPEPVADRSSISQSNQTLEVQRKSTSSFADSSIQQNDLIPDAQSIDGAISPEIPTDIVVLQPRSAQGIQRKSDLTDSETSLVNSDRILEVSSDIDLSPVDSTISQTSSIPETKENFSSASPEIPDYKSTAQSDRTPEVQRKSDLIRSDVISSENPIESNIPQADISQAIQTQSNTSNTFSQRDRIPEVQRNLASSLLDNSVLQSDLDPTIQQNFEQNLGVANPETIANNPTSLSDRAPELQRKSNLTNSENLVSDIAQIAPQQVTPTQSNSLPVADSTIPQSDRPSLVQTKSDITNPDISVEQNENKTFVQMMADDSALDDLQLPTVIQNLGQTDRLGNFSSLISAPKLDKDTSSPSQTSQISSPNSFSPNSLLSNLPPTIQTKQDNSNTRGEPISMGWSNIAELLANLPPSKQSSSSSSTNSLNIQTKRSTERSPLADNSTRSTSNQNQTIIQRSPDNANVNNDDDRDLYLTPQGLQKGNPNKTTNNLSNQIQHIQKKEGLPEANVSVNPPSTQDSNSEENFSKNLEALAQEIYLLLRQRLEIEKDRLGGGYQGRLPW
ncbi:MAG: hypothetical protein DCF19_19845 [Pseudanabaena frigida]|uniref:Uncharacterized protein n=1 Tax=Pseudanabaena frigida TaxID=945775 RepID=A0A2W4VYK3_9CYAN|nr:MAG: hypothetical protein DCF19_19845 [Pseudanabaena frigida]